MRSAVWRKDNTTTAPVLDVEPLHLRSMIRRAAAGPDQLRGRQQLYERYSSGDPVRIDAMPDEREARAKTGSHPALFGPRPTGD